MRDDLKADGRKKKHEDDAERFGSDAMHPRVEDGFAAQKRANASRTTNSRVAEVMRRKAEMPKAACCDTSSNQTPESESMGSAKNWSDGSAGAGAKRLERMSGIEWNPRDETVTRP